MFFTDVLFDVNRSEYTGNGKKKLNKKGLYTFKWNGMSIRDFGLKTGQTGFYSHRAIT